MTFTCSHTLHRGFNPSIVLSNPRSIQKSRRNLVIRCNDPHYFINQKSVILQKNDREIGQKYIFSATDKPSSENLQLNNLGELLVYTLTILKQFKQEYFIDKIYQSKTYDEIIEKYSLQIKQEISGLERDQQKRINKAITQIKGEIASEHWKLGRSIINAEHVKDAKVEKVRKQISDMNLNMARYFRKVLDEVDDPSTIGKLVTGEGVNAKEFFIAIAESAIGGILGDKASELANRLLSFIKETYKKG